MICGQLRRQDNKIIRRLLLSSDSGTINGPSSPTQSWERSARLVKNTKVKNEYLEHIRDTHDPSLHLKTLEDELRGTMGKALGKQGDKILSSLRGMEREFSRYQELVVMDKKKYSTELAECVELHNEYRKQAMKARWELIVHRQAVGFIVNNHRFVLDKYPIGKALTINDDDDQEATDNDSSSSKVKRKEESNSSEYGQLDWWQRIGRWR